MKKTDKNGPILTIVYVSFFKNILKICSSIDNSFLNFVLKIIINLECFYEKTDKNGPISTIIY